MSKNFYVYCHKDVQGNIFYVGKGVGKRAWSRDRHPTWNKYVSEQLQGDFIVEIIHENLNEMEALEIEETLIDKYGERLVNWFNSKRDFDYDALTEFHKRRDANRLYVAATKSLEISNPNEAIVRYRKALDVMREYESLTLERGLIAELNVGPNWGDPNILDRLTICLIKQSKVDEAIDEAEKYFRDFPTVLNLTTGKKIKARIDKLNKS